MKRQIVFTENTPKPVGPYSQAVWAGDLLFCAGQIPTDLTGDIREQTRQVLTHLGAVLRSQGLGYRNVVKTTVFLVDLNDFQAMNEIYATCFPEEPPARSTVQVSRLPQNARVEIEAVACR